MARSTVKLTKRVIDALTPTAGKDLVVFDADLAGFGVRVKPSGAKSYLIQYRNKFGRVRRFTIARVGDLMLAQARTKALKLRAQIIDGADPAAERREMRSSITVAELCDAYLEEGRNRKPPLKPMRPNTILMTKSLAEAHIKPLLGSRAVTSLTKADLQKFVRDVAAGKTAKKPGSNKRGGNVRGGPGAAARAIEVLGAALQQAVENGVIDRNLARAVRRHKADPYKPPFSFDALAAVGKAMRAARAEGENVTGLNVLRFLALTGCRRMEALTLRWRMVDPAKGCLRLEETKTTGHQIRPIGRAAFDHLANIEPASHDPNDFVFPGAGKSGHFIGLPKAWARVSKRAGIKNVTVHGLRHWFASAGAELNYSELVIAGLLGHAARSVTSKYATAPDKALRAAADSISMAIAGALDGKTKSNVVRLPGGKHA
jgi:integrase